MAYLESFKRYTNFDEGLVATRTSSLNYKPTWGVTELRYDITETGTDATADETGGEMRLQSGASTSGEAIVQTKARAQYQAGTQGEWGWGGRFPTAPTSTQFTEWGLYDDENGFGFGYDATGVYVFYRTAGTSTKTYKANWNVNTLSSLDMTAGHIFQGEYAWYGYGDIRWYVVTSENNRQTRTLIHREIISSSVSVQDPNQPLRAEVGNGITSTSNLIVYFGGHQFSVVDGNSIPQERPVTTILSDYTLANNTNWQPLIAIRKKTTFNGRPNSVYVGMRGFQVSADESLEVRMTVNATTSNLSWTAPINWPSTETACEVKTTTGATALTTSVDGYPYDYAFLTTVKNTTGGRIAGAREIVLGQDNEVVLWVRRYATSGTGVVNSASIDWAEQW